MPRDWRAQDRVLCRVCKCPPEFHAVTLPAYEREMWEGQPFYMATDRPAHPFRVDLESL